MEHSKTGTRELVIKTAVKVYDSPELMSKDDQHLLAEAKAAMQDSYSPYSQFKVGAAILLDNGIVLRGSNQENAAYTMCLCAERVALAAADSQFQGVPVVAIAVTATSKNHDLNKPISPCGACRQSIAETEYKHETKMKIIMQGESGPVYEVESGMGLLPLGFDGSVL